MSETSQPDLDGAPGAFGRSRRRSLRRTAGLLKRFRWWLEAAGYELCESTLALLPAATVAGWGEAIGDGCWRLLGSRRRTVRRNLRIAFAGEKTLAEIDAMTREVFRRSGANLLSALRCVKIRQDELRRLVTVANPELMAEILAADAGGAVGILPHMGNWEALSQMFPLLVPDRPTGTIYRFIKNPMLDRRVKEARQRMGMVLFEKHSGPLEMAAFLRRRGWLGVLADQRVERAGEIVPYFGRLTSCTPLPALMARRTGATIFGVSMRTTAPGHWRLKFHRLGDSTSSTTACMRLLEEVIRESPEDVFWLQDRWRVRRDNPASLSGRLPRDATAAAWTRPRRALVWVRDPARAPQLPKAAAGDLLWEYVLPAGNPAPAWLPAGACTHILDTACADIPVLAKALLAIDEAAALPLEFVIVDKECLAVQEACRKLDFSVIIPASGQEAVAP
ncbi:Lauroyl/myristoyl acyltransferase [Opitutaceae bacterium TAV1]|nr:Lauroyl/myristoyl acyltransferase [Opitutaceae bacterium TAV1]